MSQTIKEFLVSLGWETNQTGQKQFESAIESATLKARLLGDGLEELARKVLDSVSNVAENFDRLYFQAQRTNTAAATVSDFVKVMAQAGVSAGEASGSIENMAAKLREGSIAVQDVNRMGFGLNPLTHELEVQQKYVLNLANMSDAQVVAGAKYAGVSVNVAMAMKRQGQAVIDQLAGLAAFRETLGFDYKQAEADANRYMTVWRSTQNMIGAISDDIGAKLTTAMIGPLSSFNEFLKLNTPAIGKDIDIIMAGVSDMTAGWTKDIDKLIRDPAALADFNTTMTGIATAIADMARNFHNFIQDLVQFNQGATNFANMLNGLTGQTAVGSAFSGLDPGPGGGTGAAGGAAPADTRTFWQRHAPKLLGGVDAPAAAVGGAAGEGSSAGSLTELINQAAAKEGIDPRIMQGIRAGESGHGSHYDKKDDAIESSWGPFQLNRRRGLGVAFEKDTGLDVRNPSTIPAQAAWVAHYIKVHSGTNGQWMGYHGNRDADPSWGNSGYVPTPAEASAPKAGGTGAAMPGASTPDGIVSRLQAMKQAGLISNEQCVSLAAAAVGLGPGQWNVHDWRRAESAAAGTMTPGQPMATFLDRHGGPSNLYAGGGSGTPGANLDHAGVFQNYIKDASGNNIGFNMAEQFAGSGGIHSKAYYFGKGLGERDASNYSAIKSAASGTYLGGKGAPSAPAGQSPGWQGAGAWAASASALGGGFMGGQTPTLGGAGGTSATTIHAPMDTKIIIDGLSGDPTPSPHMVAAGITQKPADLTRNLQGATF